MSIENQTKKFVFLITDSESDFLLRESYGVNHEEAIRNMSLNTCWVVVENIDIIKSFIKEKKAEEIPNNLTGYLANQWLEYDENLNLLESQLEENELSYEEFARYELVSKWERRLWEGEQAIMDFQERGLIYSSEVSLGSVDKNSEVN